MRQRMALLLVIGFIALLSGCRTDDQAPRSERPQRESRQVTITAVYLAPLGDAQLSQVDLNRHPEVRVVHDFAALRSSAASGQAILVDKESVDGIDDTWLRDFSRHTRVPVALIGYNDPIYAFRETLPIVGIHGPHIDWNARRLAPGFAVWRVRTATSAGTSGYLKAFDQTPTVDAVLEVTDALLAGRIR